MAADPAEARSLPQLTTTDDDDHARVDGERLLARAGSTAAGNELVSKRLPAERPQTLWCPNARTGASNRWSYPPAVEKLLRALTAGQTVLQLFGGLSRWGTKLDIDPTTKPHVRGDAWMPPFGRDSFDVVILDPPYAGINQQMKQALIRGAAFVAREHVYWFHTNWVAPDSGMHRERSWLVRVGDSCACRCLIEWRVSGRHKPVPVLNFTRGPALKYRRWLAGNVGLPLGVPEASAAVDPVEGIVTK